MDVSNHVPTTPEYTRAHKLLTDRLRLKGLGIKAPPTAKLPELTDLECIRFSQEFEQYTYEAIRRAFRLRV